MRRLCILLIVIAAVAKVPAHQRGTESESPYRAAFFGRLDRTSAREKQAAFRSRADWVVLPVSVTDLQGHFVEGLSVSDFTVAEDGRPRPIVYFSRQDVPISVAIVLDSSGSMSDEHVKQTNLRWEVTKHSVDAFIYRLKPEDESDGADDEGAWESRTIGSSFLRDRN